MNILYFGKLHVMKLNIDGISVRATTYFGDAINFLADPNKELELIAIDPSINGALEFQQRARDLSKTTVELPENLRRNSYQTLSHLIRRYKNARTNPN